jgi:hypothetical protein
VTLGSFNFRGAIQSMERYSTIRFGSWNNRNQREEVSLATATIGRRVLPVVVRGDGTRVLLTDRRIKPSAEWSEILLCRNLDAFRRRDTDALEGEWILPQASKPQAQDLRLPPQLARRF